MVELRLLAGPRGRVFGWVPGIEVGVEMQDGYGLCVDFIESSEGGEGEGVVAAEGDDLGVG